MEVEIKESYPLHGVTAYRVVEEPTFYRHSTYRWWWGCQPYALAALYPRDIPGTQFCQTLSQPQDQSAAGTIRSIENNQVTLSGIEPGTFRLVA
jgi:hypothetical protein